MPFRGLSLYLIDMFITFENTRTHKLKTALFTLLLVILVLLIATPDAQAQQGKRVIQLSGVILGEDSVSGLPGVTIFIPKAGRGTSSNLVGFFSLPVLVGDSVLIKYVGYEQQHFIVPDYKSDYITIIVEMVPDTTYLQTVQIMPFPTEELFKEAVLALNIPMDDKSLKKDNLNAELLALMMQSAPMDGGGNYRYYMDYMAPQPVDRFSPRTNPFFNPFNWARFLRDIKQNR
jgi:hypothetical protein